MSRALYWVAGSADAVGTARAVPADRGSLERDLRAAVWRRKGPELSYQTGSHCSDGEVLFQNGPF